MYYSKCLKYLCPASFFYQKTPTVDNHEEEGNNNKSDFTIEDEENLKDIGNGN